MQFPVQEFKKVLWVELERALAEECVTYQEAFGVLPLSAQKHIMMEAIACADCNSEGSQQQQLAQEYNQHQLTAGDAGYDAETDKDVHTPMGVVKQNRDDRVPIIDLTHGVRDIGDDCVGKMHYGDHGVTREKHIIVAGKELPTSPRQGGQAQLSVRLAWV